MLEMKRTKRQEREEKKRKKLAALANLVQLNDHDRKEALQEAREGGGVGSGDELIIENSKAQIEGDDDGFIAVTHKKKKKLKSAEVSAENANNDDEPEQKRVKLTEESAADGHNSDNSESSTQDESLQKMKLTLTAEQYKELKRQLRERKRQLENVPILRLRELGRRACLDVPQEQRTPIFLTDIQHLLMSALIGNKSPCRPDRWCFLEKPVKLSHSVVLILEGLSLFHYMSNESKFEQTNKIFDTKLEMVLPSREKCNIMQDLAQVPITNVQAKQMIEDYGSLESAIEMNKDPTLLVNQIFSIEQPAATPKEQTTLNLPEGDTFPRTKLLLSALQMVDEGYPLPLQGELNHRFNDFVYTKEKYEPVTEHSPMFGIDCEMCRTTSGMNELTRISIVNEKFETVYETFVMPTNKIVDYLTRYSGITEEIMKTVTKSLGEVHKDVQQLLPPDAILVGQSLNCDLMAMKMMHPYVIDTSVCFNLTGVRKRKSKLQTLAMTFLKETIQEDLDGHDSVEDSLASLKLVKMKLANHIDFGDEVLTQKKRLNEIIRMATSEDIKNNLFAHATRRDKRTAIVTKGTLHNKIKSILKKAQEATTDNTLNAVSMFELDSNKEVVQKAREIALEHSLTIANLHVSAESFHQDSVERTVEKLDKWIGKLWKTIAHNGMFLVLMGGAEECPSGVAKIAIKKNVGDVAAKVPITV